MRGTFFKVVSHVGKNLLSYIMVLPSGESFPLTMVYEPGEWTKPRKPGPMVFDNLDKAINFRDDYSYVSKGTPEIWMCEVDKVKEAPILLGAYELKDAYRDGVAITLAALANIIREIERPHQFIERLGRNFETYGSNDSVLMAGSVKLTKQVLWETRK